MGPVRDGGMTARAHSALARLPVRPVVVLSGRSMMPTIPEGARVRVVPLERAPAPGDVVLLSAATGWLVHRAVHRERFACGERLFHRGDGAGAIGLAPVERALGLVVAVLDPAEAAPLSLDRQPFRLRRAFGRARARCRLYSELRRLAEHRRLDRLARCLPAARLAGALLR